MSECSVCEDAFLLQQATCDEKSFRWNLLKSVCYLIEAVEQEVVATPTTVILPQVVVTAAEVESDYASYTSLGLVGSTKKLNSLRILNNTDADLEFSFDGGTTTAFTVLAGTSYQENLNITLSATTSFKMQKINTAGTGSVYIEGRYNT